MPQFDPMDPPVSLKALVDREQLRASLEPLWVLTRVALRVFDTDATAFVALEDTCGPAAICKYVYSFETARASCETLVQLVRHKPITGSEGDSHRCFTGAEYRACDLRVDGRLIGRLVVGPFRSPQASKADPCFAGLDRRIDSECANRAFARLPSLTDTQVDSILHGARATVEGFATRAQNLAVLRAVQRATPHGPAEELARKNDELERANAHLRELDRVKGNFLATISHELKTPLTSILGYAEMLSENIGGVLTDEQRAFVGVISDRARQLLAMITSIIEIARLDQGLLRARVTAVSVRELAREVADTFVPVARKKRILLQTRMDHGALEARADAGYLRQVLHNLVDNAIKFTPEGGTVTIEVRPTTAALVDPTDELVGREVRAQTRPAVEVRVTDTGVGIPESERTRVFDAFYQVDTGVARQFGGAGLGLAIVRRIIDGLGGTVRVEDTGTGQGVAMVVTLPAANA